TSIEIHTENFKINRNKFVSNRYHIGVAFSVISGILFFFFFFDLNLLFLSSTMIFKHLSNQNTRHTLSAILNRSKKIGQIRTLRTISPCVNHLQSFVSSNKQNSIKFPLIFSRRYQSSLKKLNYLNYEIIDGIAVVRFDCPDSKVNSLNEGLMQDAFQIFNDLHVDLYQLKVLFSFQLKLIVL
ncbi:hypothetical protein SSS_04821, partial [Sarcoptes scabiei]